MPARPRHAAAPVLLLVLLAAVVATAIALGTGGGADLMPHGDPGARSALEAAGLRP